MSGTCVSVGDGRMAVKRRDRKAAALTGGGLSLRRKRLGGLLSENHIKAENDKWFCGADNIFLHFADCKFWDFPVYCIYRDAYRVWRQAYPVT